MIIIGLGKLLSRSFSLYKHDMCIYIYVCMYIYIYYTSEFIHNYPYINDRTCLHLSPSVWLDLCMHVQYVDAEEYKGTELHAGDVNDDPCWPSLSFRKHQPNPPDETGAGICCWLDLPDDQPSRPLASWVLRTEPHVAKNQCARNLSCFTC